MPTLKPVVFEGDSLENICSFPYHVRQRAGYEIDRAQNGLNPLNWKPFAAIGLGVREIRVQVGAQFRVICIAYLGDAIHVLHAFQKKTQKTRKADIDLARRRFRNVIRRYEK